MRRKLVTAVIVFILFLGLASTVFGNLAVGVKKGDWIEYSVTYSGTPSQDHALTFARIDVTDVQGTDIFVSITSRYINGTSEVFNSTLNLATGHLIDDFIIPANLKTGDTFLDQNQGNITISQTKQQSYAGAVRTVISASTSQNTYIWDQATGVSLEGTSQQPDYTMHTLVTGTNLWQPSEGLNMSVLLLVAVVVVVAIVAVVLVAIWYRKKKHPGN